MKAQGERYNGRDGDQKSVSQPTTLKLPDLGITLGPVVEAARRKSAPL
jgi:hypothetical protein